MFGTRVTAAAPFLLVGGLLAGAQDPPKSADAPRPEAKNVLAKARETYRGLPAYHFERVLLVEEAKAGGKPAKVAELTLVTATDKAKPAAAGKSFPPVNLDLCRLEMKTPRGDVLLASDGRASWFYTSSKKEYMKGGGFRDVTTSVGGSMLLAIHLFPFAALGEGAVENAKIAGEEVEVGKERRACYKIEGTIKPSPPADPKTPEADTPLDIDWLLSTLTLQGLTGGGGLTLYSPKPLDEKKEVAAAAPTRVTLWIDKESHALVRSKLTATLYKITPDATGAGGEKVEMSVTDTFATTAMKPPPGKLFLFTPPDGAKEVPNVASRREKK